MMIRYSMRAACLAAILSLPAVAVQAQPTQIDRGERLSVAIEKVRAKAAKLDANGDGWLSDDETHKGREKLGLLYDAVENRVDANNDGRVSVDEYVGAQVNALEAADTNADGWISEDEASAHKRRLVMELLGMR